jgi:hypothetical protein
MVAAISWGSYITLVSISVIAYYLIIGFRYYRDDILQVISGRKIMPTEPALRLGTPHQDNLQQAFQQQEIFQLSESLSDEVRAFLNQAGRQGLDKVDIMRRLKSLFAKYPSIKDSAFHELLNEVVLTESKTICSIHLSEQELSELW